MPTTRELEFGGDWRLDEHGHIALVEDCGALTLDDLLAMLCALGVSAETIRDARSDLMYRKGVST